MEGALTGQYTESLMNETMKVGLACALGALFGTLIVLTLNPYLSPLGFFLGGAVGWFFQDHKQALLAAGKILRGQFTIHGTFPDRLYSMLLMSISYSTVLIGVIIGIDGIIFTLSGTWVDLNTDGPLEVVFCTPIAWLILFTIIAANEPLPKAEESLMMLKYVNPITGPFWLLFYFGKGMVRLTVRIPTMAAAAARLFKRWFILVHSEKRFICFVDSIIGTGIGVLAAQHYGQPTAIAALIGAAAGALIGVINYEIVSIRWLKLKPA